MPGKTGMRAHHSSMHPIPPPRPHPTAPVPSHRPAARPGHAGGVQRRGSAAGPARVDQPGRPPLRGWPLRRHPQGVAQHRQRKGPWHRHALRSCGGLGAPRSGLGRRWVLFPPLFPGQWPSPLAEGGLRFDAASTEPSMQCCRGSCAWGGARYAVGCRVVCCAQRRPHCLHGCPVWLEL